MSVTERPHPSTICDASQVRGDMIGGSGTGRCVNTDPLLTTITRTTEEVAGMHPSIGPRADKGPGVSRRDAA